MRDEPGDRTLIYDWNGDGAFCWPAARVAILDDTLREGLRPPPAVNPPIDVNHRLLRRAADLGCAW